MYITVEELGMPEDMLVRLTDDEGSGMVNAGRVQAAIDTAEARVDAALSVHHETPLNQVSGAVKSLVRDVAVYNLYLRVGGVPEEVAVAYRDAAGILERVSMGLFHPGLASGPPGPSISSADREFTREYMEGY